MVEDDIWEVNGELRVEFNCIPTDKKGDYKRILADMKKACKKVLEDYNGTGSDLEFECDFEVTKQGDTD